MANLIKANKIMERINICVDNVKGQMYEFDTKRMHDNKAHLVYEGLRFSYIELCKMQGEVEELLIND